MELNSIGKNIRKYRQQRKMRQEDLAERTNLSVNYIGMIERGDKVPALDTFIVITNALGVSADMLLCDIIDVGYKVKASILSDELSKLSKTERERFWAVAEAFFVK